jgi:hypothetical protein
MCQYGDRSKVDQIHSKTRHLRRIAPAPHKPDHLDVHPPKTRSPPESDVDPSSKAVALVLTPPHDQEYSFSLPPETTAFQNVTYTFSSILAFNELGDQIPNEYLPVHTNIYAFSLSDISLTDMAMTL